MTLFSGAGPAGQGDRVTEVKAFKFNASTVGERCAADPALKDELTRRLFQVVAGRLEKTRAKLISRSCDMSPCVPA